MLSDKKKN